MADELGPHPELEMRFTTDEDAKPMRTWFDEPGILRWFPMETPEEIEDSVMRWISFSRFDCSLTALLDGEVVGIATLYLQPYRKLMHQCEFGIIVNPDYRGKGIGTDLLRNIEHLAKTRFKIELLHLQVYQDNPAVALYKRFGYQTFGEQSRWIKEGDGYRGRIFMEKSL